jgi:hypothetical protein
MHMLLHRKKSPPLSRHLLDGCSGSLWCGGWRLLLLALGLWSSVLCRPLVMAALRASVTAQIDIKVRNCRAPILPSGWWVLAASWSSWLMCWLRADYFSRLAPYEMAAGALQCHAKQTQCRSSPCCASLLLLFVRCLPVCACMPACVAQGVGCGEEPQCGGHPDVHATRPELGRPRDDCRSRHAQGSCACLTCRENKTHEDRGCAGCSCWVVTTRALCSTWRALISMHYKGDEGLQHTHCWCVAAKLTRLGCAAGCVWSVRLLPTHPPACACTRITTYVRLFPSARWSARQSLLKPTPSFSFLGLAPATVASTLQSGCAGVRVAWLLR